MWLPAVDRFHPNGQNSRRENQMRAIGLALVVIAGCLLTQISTAEEACVAVSNGIMCGDVVSPDQPIRQPSSSPPPGGQQSDKPREDRRNSQGTDQRSDRRDQDRREERADKITDDRRVRRLGSPCDRRGERTEDCRQERNHQRFEEWRKAERLRDRRYREWLRWQRQGCGCGEWR